MKDLLTYNYKLMELSGRFGGNVFFKLGKGYLSAVDILCFNFIITDSLVIYYLVLKRWKYSQISPKFIMHHPCVTPNLFSIVLTIIQSFKFI